MCGYYCAIFAALVQPHPIYESLDTLDKRFRRISQAYKGEKGLFSSCPPGQVGTHVPPRIERSSDCQRTQTSCYGDSFYLEG